MKPGKRRFPDGSPASPAAMARREAMVRKLLLDAQSAATECDHDRVTRRTSEIKSVLPRVTDSFARQVSTRLEAISMQIRPPSPPEPSKPRRIDRVEAIRRLKWFVLESDGQIHRQHPGTSTDALCGHRWISPVWEGGIGRNDHKWCTDCQREVSRIKEARNGGKRTRPIKSRAAGLGSKSFEVVRVRKVDTANLKALRERNQRYRDAYLADQPVAFEERAWRWGRIMAGSPGLGKRR